VEDNPINQEVACQMLESVGMQVSTAENGKVAVEKARQSSFDLLLMDVQMPVMDGLQATSLIRNLPNCKTVPILAMTANAFDTDRDLCIKAGMNDHVVKPVEPEKLYQSLVKWLPERMNHHPESVDAGPSVGEASTRMDDSTDGDALKALKAIDGLDVDAALGRMTGNTSLYIRLLRQFLNNHRQDAVKLSDHMAAGYLDAIAHMVHSLKGLAGTLGAVRLEQAALEAEKLVRRIGPDNEIEHRLNTMITELTGLLLALDTVFHQKNDSRLIVDVDRSKIVDILNQLETFLSASDAAANDLFEQSSSMLTASLGHAAEKLGRQIDDFDYADALKTLLAARKNSFL